jgi:hypothetical protein
MIYAEAGYDAIFLGRIDYQDKARREMNQELQFVWRPFSYHYENKTEIFTSILHNLY